MLRRVALRSRLPRFVQALRFVKSKKGKDAIRAGGVTADMAAAIFLYTCESGLYKNVNVFLRKRDRKHLLPYFPFLRLLLEALERLKTGTLKMSNRGVRMNLVRMHPELYALGEIITWWALSSTALTINVLENPMFLGTEGERTIFQIHTKHGATIAPFSAIPVEDELLLPPGFTFKITGILQAGGGLTIVQCEDDADAPPMVA
jgi:hypothetical protein